MLTTEKLYPDFMGFSIYEKSCAAIIVRTTYISICYVNIRVIRSHYTATFRLNPKITITSNSVIV
nr:MAG TPA: hypothetical protein [Bacteriophage sp.]